MRAKALIVLVFVALTVLIAITVPTKVGASTLPSNCDVWAGLCLQFNVLTPHFAIFYNTTGPFSVTDSWAHNVSIMAENAYDRLVVKDGFDPPARNPLPIYLDLTDGGFTTLIESDLSTLQIEFRTKSPCTPSCGLPTSYFELAHEIFHAIQYTEHDGQISFGRWLSEGSANWAGYEVTGNESRWDPWVVDGW